jgi:hypothetical protein
MPNRPHHSKKMHDCVDEVMAKGHEESSAWAICTASLQGAGEDIYASDNAPEKGTPVNWPAFTLGKPFKPFKKKKPGEKPGDSAEKPKWTPPWLKK